MAAWWDLAVMGVETWSCSCLTESNMIGPLNPELPPPTVSDFSGLQAETDLSQPNVGLSVGKAHRSAAQLCQRVLHVLIMVWASSTDSAYRLVSSTLPSSIHFCFEVMMVVADSHADSHAGRGKDTP